MSDIFMLAMVAGSFCGCAASQPPREISAASQPSVSVQTLQANLKSSRVQFDLYLPPGDEPAPLVIVAHGWLRGRAQMAGWGQKLADEGFIAAVPDLPRFSDHPYNASAMNELIAWLCAYPSLAARIDAQKIGIVGYSSGGLSTLLAAADNSKIRIWVGLDPVDLHGWGVEAAKRFDRKAVIVRAPPSSWNHQGNAQSIVQSLPRGCVDIVVPDAIHIDPEWPTDWQMEFLIGKSSESRREIFVNDALGALQAELMNGHAVAEARPRYNSLASHLE